VLDSALRNHPPMTPVELHLTLGSRFENIELAEVVLDDALASREIGEDDRHWVGLALREAVANAIRHGNREDGAKRVTVDARIAPCEVEVVVEDQGSGFEPEEVADPLAPENLLRVSGRGIFYMRRFMDDVAYDTGSAGGTRVTLRRRFAGES